MHEACASARALLLRGARAEHACVARKIRRACVMTSTRLAGKTMKQDGEHHEEAAGAGLDPARAPPSGAYDERGRDENDLARLHEAAHQRAHQQHHDGDLREALPPHRHQFQSIRGASRGYDLGFMVGPSTSVPTP